MSLLKAIRTVSRMESSPLRQGIFDDIASRSTIIRMAVGVHSLCRKLGISHLIVAKYGMLYFLRAKLPATTPHFLAIAYLANEVKQLDDLDRLLEDTKPERVRWSFIQAGSWLALFRALCHPKDALRFLRIFRRIEKNLRFMPACRVAVTWFLYARFRQWLTAHKVQAIIVTSDYSPESAALTAAASSLGIRRIYMPHALPSLYIKGRTLLEYELYILDSPAMRDRFAAMWPLTGNTVYRGVRGSNRPLQRQRLEAPNPRFGIFLSGPTDMRVLNATISALQRLNPAHILIRGHPVSFSNPDFTSIEERHTGVTLSQGTTLLEDADACDLIIAPNTTAFLETLKYGIAGVYLGALDFLPDDYNGFVKDGLLPAVLSATSLDMQVIKQFYTTAWEERMAYFDAAYNQDSSQLQQGVRDALQRMAAA